MIATKIRKTSYPLELNSPMGIGPNGGDIVVAVWAPNMVVMSPIKSRLSPHVASRVSTIRPYRNRISTHSTIRPMRPTTSGARMNIATQIFTPLFVDTMTV